MLESSLSFVLASYLTGVVEGRFVLFEEKSPKRNAVLPSLAYGLVSVPFTFLGASPGAAVVEAILGSDSMISGDSDNRSNSGAANETLQTHQGVGNNLFPTSSITNSGTVRKPLRSRGSLAQEARERNSNKPVTGNTIPEQPTSSTAPTAKKNYSTSGLLSHHYIRFYNNNNFITGLQRIRMLFMATGIITGYIHYQHYTNDENDNKTSIINHNNNSESENQDAKMQLQLYLKQQQQQQQNHQGTVLRFISFLPPTGASRTLYNITTSKEDTFGFTILPVLCASAANNYTQDTKTTTPSDGTNYYHYYLNLGIHPNWKEDMSFLTSLCYCFGNNKEEEHEVTWKNGGSLLCEAHIRSSSSPHELFPFLLWQHETMISPTELLLSTAALQSALTKNSAKQQQFCNLIRILLVDDEAITNINGCCRHVVDCNQEQCTMDTLIINFPHLVQHSLLATIFNVLESATSTNESTATTNKTNDTNDSTTAIEKSTTDATIPVVIRAIDSLGKFIRKTSINTWQFIRDTATISTTTAKNFGKQHTIYLVPDHISCSFFAASDYVSDSPKRATKNIPTNARQSWIQNVLKNHGINATLQQPPQENSNIGYIILFCGQSDEETIGSMVDHYLQHQHSPSKTAGDEVHVICLLEKQNSVHALKELLKDLRPMNDSSSDNNNVINANYICCCLEDIREEAFNIVRQYLAKGCTFKDIQQLLNKEQFSFRSP